MFRRVYVLNWFGSVCYDLKIIPIAAQIHLKTVVTMVT